MKLEIRVKDTVMSIFVFTRKNENTLTYNFESLISGIITQPSVMVPFPMGDNLLVRNGRIKTSTGCLWGTLSRYLNRTSMGRLNLKFTERQIQTFPERPNKYWKFDLDKY